MKFQARQTVFAKLFLQTLTISPDLEDLTFAIIFPDDECSSCLLQLFNLNSLIERKNTSAIYLIFFFTCAQSPEDFEHMCGISAPFTLCNRAATRSVSYYAVKTSFAEINLDLNLPLTDR